LLLNLPSTVCCVWWVCSGLYFLMHDSLS
jgi:hypothetical protein